MAKERASSEHLKKAKAAMVKLKNSGLLPKGYAKEVAKELGLDDHRKVYQVAGGHVYHQEIAEAIYRKAKANKMLQLVSDVDELLED